MQTGWAVRFERNWICLFEKVRLWIGQILSLQMKKIYLDWQMCESPHIDSYFLQFLNNLKKNRRITSKHYHKVNKDWTYRTSIIFCRSLKLRKNIYLISICEKYHCPNIFRAFLILLCVFSCHTFFIQNSFFK